MKNAGGLSIVENTDFWGAHPSFSLKKRGVEKNIMLCSWRFRRFAYRKKPVPCGEEGKSLI
jgi:hypothetical protein